MNNAAMNNTGMSVNLHGMPRIMPAVRPALRLIRFYMPYATIYNSFLETP